MHKVQKKTLKPIFVKTPRHWTLLDKSSTFDVDPFTILSLCQLLTIRYQWLNIKWPHTKNGTSLNHQYSVIAVDLEPRNFRLKVAGITTKNYHKLLQTLDDLRTVSCKISVPHCNIVIYYWTGKFFFAVGGHRKLIISGTHDYKSSREKQM